MENVKINLFAKAIASLPVKVTLYEDRAEVVRSAEVKLHKGMGQVLLGPISPFVDDRSVQAELLGEGTQVVSARVLRRLHFDGGSKPDGEQLETAIRRAREKIWVREHEIARSSSGRERCLAVIDQWLEAVAEVPWSPDEARLESWRKAFEALQTASDQALDTLFQQRLEKAQAQDEFELARLRYDELRSLTPICEGYIEVQVECDAAIDAKITVTYRTPCALWRPEHLARLVTEGDDAESGQVEILTWATIWQLTGEHWEDVEVNFSTARPARISSPPTIDDDVIWSRKKTSEERKHVVVETWNQDITTAGQEGVKAVAEMPGVDDGGEPQCYQASSSITLPSNGQPFRVEIGRTTHEATVERLMLPELTPVAHYKAKATHKGANPILAGPAQIVRGGGMIGRSRLDFVAPGEPFEMGFGPDDALRVKREQYEQHDKVKVIGTQIIKRTVYLFISNLSGATKKLRVTERIPVSEIEQVEIRLKVHDGWEHDQKDGFLHRTVTLGPRATQKFTLKYHIRADSKVQLPF